MRVKPHEVVTELQDDPAEYAVKAGLVGVHEPYVLSLVGAWRWTILHGHKDRIKELVSAGYTIDLGGAAAPVGYGAVVVDYQNPHDAPRSLLDVPPGADCIFCSHTLEHFTDLDGAVAGMRHKLRDGGHLVIVVPSWQRQQLQARNWAFHEQTFCLSWETNAPEEFTRLDSLLEEHGFSLEVSEFEPKRQNILVIAKKC